MGNNQAKALGNAVKYTKAENLNVINNRLTNEGANSILENVNTTLKTINLSNNTLFDLDKLRAIREAKYAKSEAGIEKAMLAT